MAQTVKEIAKHAGVSTATVSRVVNGDTNVSAPTFARVMSSISELGYSPNTHAAALARKKEGISRNRRQSPLKGNRAVWSMQKMRQSDSKLGEEQKERLRQLQVENLRLKRLLMSLAREIRRGVPDALG